MTRQLLIIALILFPCLVHFASAQNQNQPLPTPQDLQQMFDAKQYNLCLQQIARVTRSKTPNANGNDPDQLQLLRGECYIQLADRVHAIKAFGAAQAASDPKTALMARANFLLLQKTPGWQFPSDTGSIDIVNPDSRRKAMSALFAIERKKADPAIQRAKNAQTIEPILAAVPTLKDLAALELTATGDDKEIFPMFSAVGARARDLIAAALPPLDSQISTIERRSNESVTMAQAGGWWVNAGRRGLDTPDRAALEQLVGHAETTRDITHQGLMIAKSMKGNIDQWQQLANSADNVVTHARNVLDAE